MKTEIKMLITLSCVFAFVACGLLIADDSDARYAEVPDAANQDKTYPLYSEDYELVQITGKDGNIYSVKYTTNFTAVYKGDNVEIGSYLKNDIKYLGIRAYLDNEGEPSILLPTSNVTLGDYVDRSKLDEKFRDKVLVDNRKVDLINVDFDKVNINKDKVDRNVDYVILDFVEYQFNITITESDGSEITYTIPGVADLLIKKTPLSDYISIRNFTYNSEKQKPTINDVVVNDKLWMEVEIFKNKSMKASDIIKAVNADEYTNHGNYTATIVLADEYRSVFAEGFNATIEEVPWKIVPASLVDDMINVHFDSATYNGKYQAPEKLYATFKTTGKTVVIDNEKEVKYSFVTTMVEGKDSGTYYQCIIGDEDYKDELSDVPFVIKKKSIEASWITINPNKLTYTGEPQTPESIGATLSIVDPDLKYTINSKYYTVKYTPITEPGFGNTSVSVKSSCPNYQGSVKVNGDANKNQIIDKNEWAIVEPAILQGEIHVNIIYTDGVLTGDMFTDSNTFIYPYASEYRTYDDNGEYIGDQHPDIHRNNYRIVVLDANGDFVINEMNDPDKDDNPGKGFTTSEWNHIEIYGTNGYKGCITGTFYVSFTDTTSYDVGSTFSEDGLVYTVTSLDNKTVSVTGYESGIQAGVAIPDYVDGFKVTKIGAKAFYGCKTITSVDLGDNITSVGIKAFANCTKLETVVFDDALKTISAYAFYNCGKLTSIDLPDKVRTVGSYAFYKCNALTSVSFDDALKTVGTKAFTVSFENASGKVIKQTAKNLAGKTFEGSDKVLKLVA